jgi:hypothetical protein
MHDYVFGESKEFLRVFLIMLAFDMPVGENQDALDEGVIQKSLAHWRLAEKHPPESPQTPARPSIMANRSLSDFSKLSGGGRIYLSEVPPPKGITSDHKSHPVADCLGLPTNEDGTATRVFRFLGFEADKLNFDSTVLVALSCDTKAEPSISSPAGDDIVSASISEPSKIPYVTLTWGTGITKSTFAARK